MNKSDIQYISNTEIDCQKWDECVASSPDAVVYAYSWYLDRISDSWDALVLGDYQYIMPLIYRKKFGISYIYQPVFCQQLGVFAPTTVSTEVVDLFLSCIPDKFRLAEMNLHPGNTPSTNRFQVNKRTTHLLDLRPSPEQIRQSYHTNTRRNIRKAENAQLYVSPLYSTEEFIRFTRQNLLEKTVTLHDNHFSSLQKVIDYTLKHHSGEMAGVYSENNQLLAAAFFVYSGKQAVYLAASSSAEGTEKKAMFLLIDSVIARQASNKRTLDFEGSDIPGIARFYRGFGAQPVSYRAIRRNTLPWPIRLLKK